MSCITKAVLAPAFVGFDGPHIVSFGDRYIPLQGTHRLELSIRHRYDIVAQADGPGTWTARSTGYWYQVRQANGPDVLAYHWHPLSHRGQVAFPHVHLGGSTSPIDLAGGKHLPTGHVAVEAVVRFLLRELHVRPLRADWEAVLATNEADFNARRTW